MRGNACHSSRAGAEAPTLNIFSVREQRTDLGFYEGKRSRRAFRQFDSAKGVEETRRHCHNQMSNPGLPRVSSETRKSCCPGESAIFLHGIRPLRLWKLASNSSWKATTSVSFTVTTRLLQCPSECRHAGRFAHSLGSDNRFLVGEATTRRPAIGLT